MDTTLLRKAGLTESQAKGYLALIEHGALSPADLAEKTSESRTNGYMICEKLEQLGLATKKEGKKALYTPNHPSALETLAEKRRKALVRNEQEVKGALPSLIDFFYQYQSTPGVEFGYGSDGVEKIRARTLAKGQKLYFVRTGADQNYDQEKLAAFINHRVAAGIQAQSLAPTNNTHTRSQEQLEAWLLDRTLLPAKQYTAPVEVDIFGDTVAFIDFENDGMSTMITSQNIADAMRQLFLIAKESTDDQTPS
ncbi:MAG: TrmB family transcriptional regulator [Acidobacteriota bacterium]